MRRLPLAKILITAPSSAIALVLSMNPECDRSYSIKQMVNKDGVALINFWVWSYDGKVKHRLLLHTVMLPLKKKIVTDETSRPVAVLIDYQDWQKIEKILEAYQLQQKEEFSLNQYAGVITLNQDPLEYQQQIRDEWS